MASNDSDVLAFMFDQNRGHMGFCKASREDELIPDDRPASEMTEEELDAALKLLLEEHEKKWKASSED